MAEIIETELDEALEAAKASTPAADRLVAWVTGYTNVWRDHRDTKHGKRWEEYYRLWRGIWDAADKQRQSERSRIITPALQQAVEGVTSEIESAILDKPHFFDMVDNDEEAHDIEKLRKLLREDMKAADFETAMNQIFLLGSIYGTGIGKLVVGEKERAAIVPGPDGSATLSTETVPEVKLVPVLPGAFLIDPAAKNIKEAMGCAHEYATPLQEIKNLQLAGTYMPGEIGTEDPDDPVDSDEEGADGGAVNIIEYNGYVPAKLLREVDDERAEKELFEDEELVDLFAEADVDDEDATMVEALVTIANGRFLLKATENPTLLKERMFLAYRHEIVPDQFWGRGVCEKGYNSQKALDASMRARIDGLALTVHPMMGIDGSKMPKGFRFNVTPGRSIITTGNPDEILRPVKFGSMDPNQFTQTSELERMVQMSTGGFDTAAPVQVNNRNETASGMSMQLGAFVKRSKRTIRNIENEFIVPMVAMVSRLYMELWPDRYPVTDVSFTAVSVLGTMARELEQAQFSAMLSTVPPQSPAFWMLVKSIYELSTLSNREQMVELIDGQLEQALNPPPPPPDPLVELKRMEIMGRIRAESARIQVEYIRARSEVARAANDARLAPSEEAKNESAAILNLAKAEAEELGSQLSIYKSRLEELERDTVAETGVAENVIKGTETQSAGLTLEDVLNGGVGGSQGGTGNPAGLV